MNILFDVTILKVSVQVEYAVFTAVVLFINIYIQYISTVYV